MLTSLVAACATDAPIDPGPSEDLALEIDAYLATLPYLPVAAPEVAKGPERNTDDGGTDYQCTVQNYAETAQYDKVVAYAANSESLYPGAIVSADSVLSGLFTQIVMPRSRATISVSLENLDGAKSAPIDNPSLSTYREALSSILSKAITGSTPASISSQIEKVHSEAQLDMALGVQASWGLGIGSLKSSFDFASSAVRSRYLVKFTQAYYTVDLDLPERPSAVFGAAVDLDAVKAEMTAQRPPAIVSSVTYGRTVLFTFESEFSTTELGAALDFAYKGGADVAGNTSVTYKDILSRSRITAFILGGDAGTATRSLDSYEALANFIAEGGNYTRESPGAPIAYKLVYLKDNAPARMSATTDYEVKTCTRISQKVKVTLESILVEDAGGDVGNNMELFGTLGADGAAGGPALFNKDRSNFVTIAQGAMFGNAQQPIGETVIQVRPQPGETVRLWGTLFESDPFFDDLVGNEVQVHSFEAGWRKEAAITFTGASSRVQATFKMTPI